MSAITAAFDSLRARAVAQITMLPLHFQDEENVLPDTPAEFVYFELVTDRGGFLEVGGGRGANRHRSYGEFHAYVFIPRGKGLESGLATAEGVAAVFRSFRNADVSCVGATVHPSAGGEALVPRGIESAADNYTCIVVSVPLYFDQTG